MSLIPCPERGCSKRVSTTALRCPSCGCDVDQFLKTRIAQRAVGFPIDPVAYWNPHFWYFSGCQPTGIYPAEPGWVEDGQPIIRYIYKEKKGTEKQIDVRSPFSGLVVRKQIQLRDHLGDVVDIGYPMAASQPAWHRTFVVVRPLRLHVSREGQPFEKLEIPGAYTSLRDALHLAVVGTNLFDRLSDRGFRRLDPNKCFESSHRLYQAADDLYKVHAIWLPEWDFDSDGVYFG